MGIDEVLRRAPVFADLDDDGLAMLRANAREIRVRRGEVLYREGQSEKQLYVVIYGKLKVTKCSEDRRELLVALFGPGDTFGEMSLFDPGPRIVTVTAVTETGLLVLDHDLVRSVLVGRPKVAGALYQQVARRLRDGAGSMADLVFLDVPGRVAKTLLLLATRFGTELPGDRTHVAHDLTQEELAQLVGASRETANKALADFVSRGWIRLSGRAMIVLNADRLRARAGGRASARLAPQRSAVTGTATAVAG